MRKLSAVVALVLAVATAAQSARAQVQFGIAAGPGGLNDFYLSIGNYFNVPPQQVTVIRDRDVPDEQIPVVLFIAQRAHVDPQEVIELRGEGFSWMDVALRFGIGPEAFYVNVNHYAHTPYGHAYGYYRRYNRNKWRHIRLTDDDVVNLVNLRFVSESSHHAPDEVVRLRGQGRSFIDINEGWHPQARPGERERGNEGDNGGHRGWDKDHGPREHQGDGDHPDERDNRDHGGDHGDRQGDGQD